MLKITVKIDGMACGMCEAHICQAIRNAMKVKKVSASHRRGEAVIIAESFSEEALKRAIGETGYTVIGVAFAPYEKRGLFGA